MLALLRRRRRSSSVVPLSLLTQALVWAMLAMSLDILLGYIGLASLGHAAYLALGAYSVGILATRYGATFWVTLVVGVVLAGDGGRRDLRARRAPRHGRVLPHDHAGARHGRVGPRASMGVDDPGRQRDRERAAAGRGLPWSLTAAQPFYYFVLAAFVLAFLVLWTVVHSPFGKTLVGIRESESRMRTLGYNVWLHKYVGFVIAGARRGLRRRALGVLQRLRQPGGRSSSRRRSRFS